MRYAHPISNLDNCCIVTVSKCVSNEPSPDMAGNANGAEKFVKNETNLKKPVLTLQRPRGGGGLQFMGPPLVFSDLKIQAFKQ